MNELNLNNTGKVLNEIAKKNESIAEKIIIEVLNTKRTTNQKLIDDLIIKSGEQYLKGLNSTFEKTM